MKSPKIATVRKNDIDQCETGSRARRFRESRGVSQLEVEAKLGLTRTTVSRLEAGWGATWTEDLFSRFIQAVKDIAKVHKEINRLKTKRGL